MGSKREEQQTPPTFLNKYLRKKVSNEAKITTMETVVVLCWSKNLDKDSEKREKRNGEGNRIVEWK